MKLAVTDIRMSAFNTLCATVDVEVEHGKSIYSVCSIDVSVPLVDEKAIKDYDEDLKNKAREIINKMHKEIVCSGKQEIKPFRIENGQVIFSTSRVTLVNQQPSPDNRDKPDIEIFFPVMRKKPIDFELNKKSESEESRDCCGVNGTNEFELSSSIVVSGLFSCVKKGDEPILKLTYTENYDEDSSFGEFERRARAYAESVISELKKRPGDETLNNKGKSTTFYHPDGAVRVDLPSL
ncbi:hypothetical protein ACVHVJ_001107 [Salmonella enterica subsp. enterica serovar Newport]